MRNSGRMKAIRTTDSNGASLEKNRNEEYLLTTSVWPSIWQPRTSARFSGQYNAETNSSSSHLRRVTTASPLQGRSSLINSPWQNRTRAINFQNSDNTTDFVAAPGVTYSLLSLPYGNFYVYCSIICYVGHRDYFYFYCSILCYVGHRDYFYF